MTYKQSSPDTGWIRIKIMKELAQQLQDNGFPLITKWEVENNYRRHITVGGEPTMPLFESIVSEIPDFGGVIKVAYSHYHNGEEDEALQGFYAFQEELLPYNDGMTQLYLPDTQEEMSVTPLEAVANLWLTISDNNNKV